MRSAIIRVLRLPVVRIGSGAIIWLTPTFAYKQFLGPGAAIRCAHEMCAFTAARRCAAWGPFLLPLTRCALPNVLRSPRGDEIAVDGPDELALRAFVDSRLMAATAGRPLLPAHNVIDRARLAAGLGTRTYRDLLVPLLARLDGALLPSGPAHGDLHRGNIVKIDGELFLLDFDRFSPCSSPLFDRIHFGLTERRRSLRRKWVELLSLSGDVVAAAMRAHATVSATDAQVALAYGMNRVAQEAFLARTEGRPRAKYQAFAERLLANYDADSGT